MDPSEVDSSADVREGWPSWDYGERVEALGQLANETLDQYGYDDDVTVQTGEARDGYTGSYEDGEITLDPGLIEDPDPEDAIHTANHETVHAMNDEDGIDDGSYASGHDDWDDADLKSYLEHGDVGDVARELDRDGLPAPAPSGGGGGGGGGDGGESGYAAGDPQKSDISVEIDWASGVWSESVDAEGNMSVEITYGAPEGW